MYKKTSYFVLVIVVVLGFSVSVQSLLAAWTASSQTAPNCASGTPGCDAPINVGLSTQDKTGSLGVGSLVSAGNLTVGGATLFNGLTQMNGSTMTSAQTGNPHFYFNSYEGLQLRLDSNNNSVNSEFLINNGANNTVFSVNESGDAIVGDQSSVVDNWPLTVKNRRNNGTTDYDVGIKFKFSNESTANEQNKWAGIKAVPEGNWANSVGLAFYTQPTSADVPREAVRINRNGNVGIGTSTPAYKLTITGTSTVFAVDNGAVFSAKSSTGAYQGYFWPRWTDNAMYMNYGQNGFFIRNNSATTTMFMNNSNNVGIGTTAVGARLQVNAPTSTEALRIVSASNFSPLNVRNNANTADIFRVDQTGSLAVGSIPWARLNSFPAACPPGEYVTAVGGALTCSAPAGGISGSGTANYLSKWSGPATLSSSVLYDDGTNIGIGTTAPGGKLGVKSTGAGSYPFRVYASDDGPMGYFFEDVGQHTIFDLFNGSGANNIRLNTNGNSWIINNYLGLGTNNPKAKLHTVGDSYIENGGLGFVPANGTSASNVIYRGGTNFTILRNYNSSSTVMQVWSPPGALGSSNAKEATIALVRGDEPNQEYIDIYNNGYSTETQHGIRIQKRGTGAFRDFVFDQYDGMAKTALMILKAGGNVGIGLPNPAYKLDVNGTINGTAVLNPTYAP